jgi:hypothetical protein
LACLAIADFLNAPEGWRDKDLFLVYYCREAAMFESVLQ